MGRDGNYIKGNGKRAEALPLISLHGGHSSDFCIHAGDPLERIVAAYADQGFAVVGITEHMPPINNDMRYPDEKAAGLDAVAMLDRFDRYFETARRIQREYANSLKLLIGFETEWYTGALPFIKELIGRHRPDYIIGSLHHVDNVCFDYDGEYYMKATEAAGGLDELYERYFDLQLEMMDTLAPMIVGHFDLIRIHDPDYTTRMRKPSIRSRIERNLKLVRDKDLLLDLNTRAYKKGAAEPYPCRAIMETAREMDIAMVPGDDCHDVPSVGYKIGQAVHMLDNLGFDTDWNSILARIAS